MFVLLSGMQYCCIFQKLSHAYVHAFNDIKNSENIILSFSHRIVTRKYPELYGHQRSKLTETELNEKCKVTDVKKGSLVNISTTLQLALLRGSI